MNRKNMYRKILAIVALILTGTSAMAEEYSYLTFETQDGAKASVEIASLAITINGMTLTAGGQTFALSNLSKMYFSASDETSTTGIGQVTTPDSPDVLAVYDLKGCLVAKSELKKGVYVVKTKTGTYKIALK